MSQNVSGDSANRKHVAGGLTLHTQPNEKSELAMPGAPPALSPEEIQAVLRLGHLDSLGRAPVVDSTRIPQAGLRNVADGVALRIDKHRAIGASLVRKSDHDDEGIQGQLALCAEKATAEGVLIPDGEDFHFIDDATSGVETERDGLLRLYALLNEKNGAPPFTYLYIKNRTRLARSEDPRWIFWFEIQLLLRGVLVRYTDEPAPIIGADGKPRPPREQFLLQCVKNLSTSMEREETLKRTREGRWRRIVIGFWPRGTAPYGTVRYLADLGTREIVCEVPHDLTLRRAGHGYKLQWAANGEAQTVQRIFRWLDAGMSLRRCARTLNSEGVPSPAAARARRGKSAGPWTSEAVRNIAAEPLYKGELWFGRSTSATAPVRLVTDPVGDAAGILRHPHFMPHPLVDATVWDRVNARLQRTAPTHQGRISDRYLLNGIPTCSHCGRRLVGQSHAPRAKDGATKTYRYYWHLRPDRERWMNTRCPYAGRVARADILEAQAEAAIAALARDSGVAAEVAAQCTAFLDAEADAALRRECRQAQAELEAVTKDRDQLADHWASLTQDSAAERHFKKKYEARCDDAEAAENRVKAVVARADVLNNARARFAADGLRHIQAVDAIVASASREDRRQFYRTVIESLVVDFGNSRATLSLYTFDPANRIA